ncbi:DUF7079 family protein [Xenorhabdus bovienii]|uniref:DUF7079 domain-containing protein n=1 Tax=Xenorhabdus bovienii TaxID=40576 RepID=A0A0B6XFU6_XENBV|nr:hypothetical protein [Xenorhabdus bovienii]MCG3471285.1 hypothetical protein [Xenorhabdus bovienii]CDG90207.1 conserved hypothetical protein [Xenorhabdus bovienii str. feltiae France]CDG92079.1 conserved hypothetical protein [Xenorhabdus bovienii str. feltiae Florida]CDM91354.1 conserved protein of unknown function [Xenorhabdus bovienii]
MGNILTDIDLCEALSYVFVDNEVDYEYIASVAKHFPLEHVEMVFFEWVAPICYTNGLILVPPVWTFFDREQLWEDVHELRRKQITGGKIEKIKENIRRCFLRKYLEKEWQRLKKKLTDDIFWR